MSSVGIHPPRTPVTEGSHGVAKATTPNVCKMPGPPAPFVPSPLPNIAKSELSPKGYSTTVKIEGNAVAIRGATFESMGDMASKGTGGGLISANTHGPAKFIPPGSLKVKIEGKSVHLLGESMLNNCGASGSPPNTGATLMGVGQPDAPKDSAEEALCKIVCECDRHTDNVQKGRTEKASCRKLGEEKHDCCNHGINLHNRQGKTPKLSGERGYVASSGALDPGASRVWARGMSPGQYFSGISGRIFPDAAILDSAGNVERFAEFKFQCPAGTPTRKGAAPSSGTEPQDWTPATKTKASQLTRTRDLSAKQTPPAKEPMLLTNENCPDNCKPTPK
jgi:uncharacterized Zn-binding protein involved in type VI secretion